MFTIYPVIVFIPALLPDILLVVSRLPAWLDRVVGGEKTPGVARQTDAKNGLSARKRSKMDVSEFFWSYRADFHCGPVHKTVPVHQA